MEELNRIKIGDREYPVKIDINVLEVIQEKYGSINQFELDILGLGNIQYDEEGNVTSAEKKEPSVKAIKAVLPAMINEGMKITADSENKEFEPVKAEDIYIREINLTKTAKAIHNELKRCFQTKK